MAMRIMVSMEYCKDPEECLSLLSIMELLNSPLDEEAAWAIFYKIMLSIRMNEDEAKKFFNILKSVSLENVRLHRDGSLHWFWSDEEKLRIFLSPDQSNNNEVLQKIGVLIYKLLDYSLGPDQERILSQGFEKLFEVICFEALDYPEDSPTLLDAVISICEGRITDMCPLGHYSKVCEALYNEALTEIRRKAEKYVESENLDEQSDFSDLEEKKPMITEGSDEGPMETEETLDKSGNSLKRNLNDMIGEIITRFKKISGGTVEGDERAFAVSL